MNGKGRGRTAASLSKNKRKEGAFKTQSGNKEKLSQYGRKHAYLTKRGLWGFEVENKPWKGGAK